jgi:sugar phosphate isomerase/epimerase
MLGDSNLNVVSLCRGGFFPAITQAERIKSIDENKKAIDEAEAIKAPLLVLVCGAVPGIELRLARKQITEGIDKILPYAKSAGIRLSIEPLHPMYSDTRSAINTLRQANDIVEEIRNPMLGVTVDVYHVWWDDTIEQEIRRAGNNVFSFHISDWRTPTRDILNDRALMGDGCINIKEIRSWVEGAGFSGYHEVEIFSTEWWSTDQTKFVEQIKEAYIKNC